MKALKRYQARHREDGERQSATVLLYALALERQTAELLTTGKRADWALRA
jgi:hypothetical protein